ncbi:MAG: type II toxin-antitoxin system PemK/MazF family toxin [Deltaproteobacteria bacterium]|nr:type II toxin-antitoxin system PemK/MazF family toxin [Deltaproteobacteria bacterium]
MARVLRRGDVVWADLNPTRGNEQAGRRPVLILSREIFNARSGTVIAAAVASQQQRAGFPLTLKIESARLPKESWAKMGQVRTLSTKRIGKRLGRVSPEELATVVEGLNEIIGD